MCGCVTAYNGDGVLANVFKPDELEGAGAEAVDSLHLVLANDAVSKGSTGLDQEHGIGIAALSVLTRAGAAVVHGPPAVVNLSGLHGDGG